MRILAPDILELTRTLSPPITIIAILIGLFLLTVGVLAHRFWLSLLVTTAAGIMGLNLGGEVGVQPLVAGLLMALAGGVMGLALARIALFLAGGLAGMIVAQQAGEGWNAFASFLAGGLLGVVFYRIWIMAVSSLAGTLLCAYGLLSLLDRLGRIDSIAWCDRNGPLLNWLLVLVAAAGFLAQLVLDRRNRPASQKAKQKKSERPRYAPPPPPPEPPSPWANWNPFNRAA